MPIVIARAALMLAVLLTAGSALAAGGAHVVDDGAVETPGTCHLETWVTASSGSSRYLNIAPACTREAWPNLEIGGFVAHGWTRDTVDTLVGLSPKLMLRSEDHGVGIGIATSIGYSADRGRFETASAIVPLTIPASDALRLNINAGWTWTRVNHYHDLFIGAQAEIALRPTLNLMIESFTRDKGKAGAQTGLRWTVAKGTIDLDLLAGRYIDGATPTSITFGVTFRR